MIKIIGVGKIKDKALTSLINEYLKRLQPYNKVEVIEVNDIINNVNNSTSQNIEVLNKEAINVLSKIKDNEFVILCDLHGTNLTSEKLASKINEVFTYKTSNITFVIGGSLGVGNSLIERADFRWKLSDLTFTHQMVRVLILEQIYRSFKILSNETYHK